MAEEHFRLSVCPPADWLKQDESAGIAVTLRLLARANLLRLQCMMVVPRRRYVGASAWERYYSCSPSGRCWSGSV